MKYANIKTLALGIALFTISSCGKKDSPTPTPTPTPKPTDPTTVSDVDGNVYNVVRIGTQLWTVENLRTTRYNDSTTIPTGLSNAAWTATSTGAYSIYNDDNANNTTYGKLYNWYAASSGKLAPKGWHIPTPAEWDILVQEVGGYSVAGGKIKSTSALWIAPNLAADNNSKFSGLPSGYKTNSNIYALLGESAYWWASTPRNAVQGDYLRVHSGLAGAVANGATKSFGLAIRCVKD